MKGGLAVTDFLNYNCTGESLPFMNEHHRKFKKHANLLSWFFLLALLNL